MKKIALFMPNFGGGGAERVMLRLSAYLVEKGFLVDVVVVRQIGPLQCMLPKEANVIVLNSKRTVFSLPKLIAYLRTYRPDAMLSTLSTANWTAALAKVLSLTDTRLVIRVASFPSRIAGESKSLGTHLNKLIYPIVSRIAFSIVAVSKGVANDLVQHCGVQANKTTVIYNPSYNEQILLMAQEPLSHPWFDDKGIVVLGVGNLGHYKDFSTLLKAFYLVRRRMEAKLIILGEGSERENLVKEIRQLQLENEVQLPGFVMNPYRYMARASVFVSSSRYEGFPNVLIESLALNTPIVSTDCKAGPREILENGKWGKLVPVGDSEQLSTAILETLREERRADLHQRARQFNLEKSGDLYLTAMGIRQE